MLHDYSARKWKMDIDGKDISDEYILWPRKSEKAKSPSDIEITVEPSALVILQPGRAGRKLA